MRRFLLDLTLFGLLQLGILAYFLHGIANRSDEYLAATVDKERLLATAPGRRVVFVGGSNLAFGLDSAELRRDLGCAPINMGVHVGLGLPFMFNEAKAGLRPGDLVVLSPEYAHFSSPNYLDGLPTLWHRLFVTNAASLRYASWRNRWIGLFDNTNGLGYFRSVVQYWAGNEPPSVAPYQRRLFNDFGDVALPREHHREWQIGIDKFSEANDRIIAAKALETVQSFVCECNSMGVDVVCAFPARRQDGANVAALREIELAVTEIMPVIIGGEEALLPVECFFDSSYHLTTEGARLRTRLLRDRLASRLSPPGSQPAAAIQRTASRIP